LPTGSNGSNSPNGAALFRGAVTTLAEYDMIWGTSPNPPSCIEVLPNFPTSFTHSCVGPSSFTTADAFARMVVTVSCPTDREYRVINTGCEIRDATPPLQTAPRNVYPAVLGQVVTDFGRAVQCTIAGPVPINLRLEATATCVPV
jgi:hypothetical protein